MFSFNESDNEDDMMPDSSTEVETPALLGEPRPGDKFSYLSPIGYFKSTNCGYCSAAGFSYYAGAISLTPQFYKTLLDRYWRRSGSLLYRPDQRKACCPHYTIRLDSTQFKASKDQRQAINRFHRHVVGDDYIKEAARRYPRSKEEAKRRDNVFDLVERIHECEIDRLSTPPEPAHKFTVTLESDAFTEEKYLVWANYQRTVHHEGDDAVTRGGFRRFLCNSPIARQTISSPDGTEMEYGSFHQCYRLDGKLVAVGVLDLVPECVSAVYFFYHESIHHFNPGKLSALREIALAIERGYRYWYPGFYIHSCAKMRYKMDYRPQYILDPETLDWDPCDDSVLSLMSEKPYVSLSRERKQAEQPDQDAPKEEPDEVAGINGTDENHMADPDGEDDDDYSMWLFNTGMPGITPLSEMLRVNLDDIGVRVGGPWPDGLYTTSDLMNWRYDTITDHGGFKASVAELVAAIGPDQIGNIRLAKRQV